MDRPRQIALVLAALGVLCCVPLAWFVYWSSQGVDPEHLPNIAHAFIVAVLGVALVGIAFWRRRS